VIAAKHGAGVVGQRFEFGKALRTFCDRIERFLQICDKSVAQAGRSVAQMLSGRFDLGLGFRKDAETHVAVPPD